MNNIVNASRAAMGAGMVGSLETAKVQPISQSFLSELSTTLSKTQNIEHRLQTIKDKLFGPTPESPTTGLKDNGNGFLGEANYKTEALHNTVDRIFVVLNDLERFI